MRKIHILFPALLAACLVAPALGQVGWYRGGVYGRVSPYGYGWPYGGFSYTQYPPGYGYAEMLRAQGEYNKNTAEARISYEEARKKYIENSVKWTEAYHERQRIGKQAQAEKYAQQRAARERALLKKQSGVPPRLGPLQLDPSTGKIYWPEALLTEAYAPYRKQLEELFVLRAHTGSSGDFAGAVRELSRKMQDELKADIKTMPPNAYLEARKFLDSLAWEGQYAPIA